MSDNSIDHKRIWFLKLAQLYLIREYNLSDIGGHYGYFSTFMEDAILIFVLIVQFQINSHVFKNDFLIFEKGSYLKRIYPVCYYKERK